MEKLNEFIKFQHETFNHFEKTIKEHEGNDKIRVDLSARMFMLNRIIQLAEIVKNQLNESLNCIKGSQKEV